MFADDASAISGNGGAVGSPVASDSGTQTALDIPDDTRKQFADFVELIVHSESMGNEDRQYWINILPIMTPEQLKSLRDILENERRQLDAIDAKYNKAVEQVGNTEAAAQMSQARKKRSATLSKAESAAKAQEDAAAEELLKNIDKA